MSKETKVLEMIAETEILGKKIKMYGSVEFPWFLAKDVAEWIDYSKNLNGAYQIAAMVGKVSKNDKNLYKVKTNGGIQKAWFLTYNGVLCILVNCRKFTPKECSLLINEKYIYNNLPKQSQFKILLDDAIKCHLNSGIDFIQCPFNDKERYNLLYKDSLAYIDEYRILKYEIDFFFPEFLICVEYDEKEHKYNKEYDEERQYEITDYLNREHGNEIWEFDGNMVTFIRVKEGFEMKGIVEIISCLMSVFIP